MHCIMRIMISVHAIINISKCIAFGFFDFIDIYPSMLMLLHGLSGVISGFKGMQYLISLHIIMSDF